MKLLLLLVAIYSLIFYQRYKMEKVKEPVPAIKESLAQQKPYSPEASYNKEFESIGLMMKSPGMIERYSNITQPVLRRLVFY